MVQSTAGSDWKAERLWESGKMVNPALLNAEMLWKRLCQNASIAGYLNTSRTKSRRNATSCAPSAKKMM